MNEKAIALTSDVDKSEYSEPRYLSIAPLMFQKINEKIPGKCGNQRTLLVYLIGQQQNGSFHPSEQTICMACGFTTASRYREAREALCALGFLTHVPYKELRINYKEIMK